MAQTRSFEFSKAYEEIEIADKVYRIDFNDEKTFEYYDAFEHFYKETQRIGEIEKDNLTPEENKQLFLDAKNLIKDLIEMLLGSGTFEPLYKLAGESTEVMIELVNEIADIVNERTNKMKEARKAKYLQKV